MSEDTREPRVIVRLYLPLDARTVARILAELILAYPDAQLTEGSPDAGWYGIVEITAVAE